MSYSGRRIYWASQETTTDWDIASDTNTAGTLDLATEGVILCGKPSRGQTLIWTTTDLWVLTYQGGDFLYGAQQVGKHCGAIGPNVCVVLDTAAYWMGNGQFYAYDGYVRPLPCEVGDYVFGNLSAANKATSWVLANPAFNEVTWFYPSSGASTPDRYVTYNYAEKHWTFGTHDRCAGISHQSGGAVPVLIASTGTVYDHETGTNRSGQTIFLESGPMEVGDGDNVQRIQRIVPDDKTLGDVDLYLYTALFPDDAETLNGPYTAASPTSVRLTARQVRIRLVEAVQTAWRVGVYRLGAIAGGRR